MAKHKMPHPNHENHLCYLENIGYLQVRTGEAVEPPDRPQRPPPA